MSFDGLLLVDKPLGWSSFDVVAKVRGILSAEYRATYGEKRKIKVGHTGTLDPLATGLMIVVVGSYCKRAQEFSKLDKVYEVEMRLGETSTTGDEEGIKTKVSSLTVEEEKLRDTLKSFVGESMQTPPAYSAIKVNGQRAYQLAREGKSVELQARPVTIHSLNLTDYNYPVARFTVHVGSGTYIRSLVEDIGNQLSVGAYMTALRRTKVGRYDIKNAQNIDNISSLTLLEQVDS